jgi:membrane-associated phospholipid phosphatase
MEVLTPARQHSAMSLAAEHRPRLATTWPVKSDVLRAWMMVSSLLLLGLMVFPFDTRIATVLHEYRNWHGWKIVILSEIFSHAWGVGLIALGIASLNPDRAPKIPQLFCASLGAGLLANLGKLIVARVRPHSFDLSLSSGESFLGWFPWLTKIAQQTGNTNSALQSFPSAHSATAAGLAWGLCLLYPQGKWYFVLLCVLAFMQRLVVEAHYVSDICWGAAVGVLWANFVFSNVKLGQRFAALEKWLALRWKIQSKIS